MTRSLLFLSTSFCLLTYISVDATVFKHDLLFRESRRVRQLRERSFTSDETPFHPKSRQLVPHNVKDAQDSEYIGIVTIGKPYQTFKVLLDTGSSILWIPGLEADASCNGKAHFDPSVSDTFRTTGRLLDLVYGQGTLFETRVSGYMAQDLVTFGPYEEAQLKVPNSLFGLALTITADLTKDTNIDGILGLGPALNYDRQNTSPIQNAIQQGLLDYPLFSVYLERHGSASNVPGGRFFYGGIDTDNCGPVIDWLPFVSSVSYQFMISGISIGNYSTTRQMQVVSDTGTPFIAAPFSMLGGIAAALGATYDSSTKSYYLPCDTDKGNFDFVIGAKTYSVEPRNYIIDINRGNTCLLAISGLSGYGMGPTWILGTPFMRQFCHIHDIGNQRMGLARSLQK